MGKDEILSLIKSLQSNQKVSSKVKDRMKEFQEMKNKDNKEWFDELCFCILTANSSARKGIEIQNYLKNNDGFLKFSRDDLIKVLRNFGHRFPEARAEFIEEARKYSRIKDIITGFKDEFEAREWLVKNVKGIGFKEASHFLRNVGYHNISILDRHILRIFKENGLIDEIPKTLTQRRYKEIEKIFFEIAKEIKVLPSEMDLYLWYTRTGEVLK